MFKVGDLVDFHREPQAKDEHDGWHGPVPVIATHADRGLIEVQLGKNKVLVRLGDARLTLYIEALFARESYDLLNEAMYTVTQHIARLTPGKPPEA